jgi:DNA-binding NarL/FixJ family response regulator
VIVRVAATGKPRVLVADDHTLVAEALAKLLDPEFEIIGLVSDGRTLLEAALKTQPHVVILDLSMPRMNGMDAGQRLKELLPNAKIVVLTATEDYDLAAEVIHSWAAGFVLKKSASRELIHAVREVLKGKSYVTVDLPRPRAHEAHSTRAPSLTMRQREVLQLLAEGRTMKETATILGVSARTVAFHKYKIMREFGLKNNSDLMRLAMKAHLVPPP